LRVSWPSLFPGQQVTIGLQRGDHRLPVADSGPNLFQRARQSGLESPATACVDALDLDIDDRFAAGVTPFSDRRDNARGVAADRQDRMQQDMNRKPRLTEAATDAVDQKRHVGVDDGKAHAPFDTGIDDASPFRHGINDNAGSAFGTTVDGAGQKPACLADARPAGADLLLRLQRCFESRAERVSDAPADVRACLHGFPPPRRS